jgi:hypothetical protein
VDLVTQVDQVRKYRNWVAHGRRGDPVNNVAPNEAFDRLGRFLLELGISVEPEDAAMESFELIDDDAV